MAVVMAGSVANPVTDSMSKSSISVAHCLPLAPQGSQCMVKRYNPAMMSQALAIFMATAALFLSAVFGYLLIDACLRATKQNLPATLIAGAALPLGLTLTSLCLRLVNLTVISLHQASWIVVGALLLAVTVLCLGRNFLKQKNYDQVVAQKALWSDFEPPPAWLVFGAGLILLSHFSLAIVNNLTIEVFPWDAFTTWMYRAKAWILDNRFTAVVNTNLWIDAGAREGIPLYASQYPNAVSDIAIWASIFSGGWLSGAASLPWAAAGIALSLSVFGVLRLSGMGSLVAGFGALMAASLPLLDMHKALAGYGDIWVALTSGLGLSLLLSWASKVKAPRQKASLMEASVGLGMVLLLIGTQIKLEGWLWLGLGILFVCIHVLTAWRALLISLCLAGCLTAYITLTNSTSVDLGSLGLWGIAENKIHIGFLGGYHLRPYNPLPAYLNALFIQKNFSLLPLFYLVALVYLARHNRPAATGHWLMGLMIVASQGAIFGLSAFSQYAESGTALNRIALQFVPVFILTSCYGANNLLDVELRSAVPAKSDDRLTGQRIEGLAFRTLPLPIVPMLLTSGVLVGILSIVFDTERSSAPSLRVAPTQMQLAVGTGEMTTSGAWQFTQSPQAIGVLRSLQAPPKRSRYVGLDVVGDSAEEAVFYWIDGRHPENMHRRRASRAGNNLFDMRADDSWRVEHIIEWGIVVPKDHFTTVELESIFFAQTLNWATVPGVIGQWLQPTLFTQRSLNYLDSEVDEGPGYHVVLVLAGAILLTMAFVSSQSMRKTILMSVAALWLLGDLLWLHSYSRTTFDRLTGDLSASTQRNEGFHLKKPVSDLLGLIPLETPALVIASDNRYDYEAQRLPFLLLPVRSAFLNADIHRVPTNWAGAVILYGDWIDERIAKAERLAQILGRDKSRITHNMDFSLLM